MDVKIAPSAVSTFVDTHVDLEAVISTSTTAKIIGFRLKTPTQFEVESKAPSEQLLRSGSDVRVQLSLKSTSPGQFNITKAIVTLKDRSRLFKHDLPLKCNADIEIAPLSSRLNARLQLGSIAGASSLGIGTDLASLREATDLTDFHSIDWKSTARTGKFIVKEFYRETEPAVMLVIDKRVVAPAGELESSTLVQLGGLVITFGTSTPMGAIIYDERNVIAQVLPASGVQGRQQILRLLLTAGTPSSTPPSQGLTTLYSELDNLIRLMKSISNNQPLGRVDIYARSILPYYQVIASKYSAKLLTHGAFRALEKINNLPPSLVIIISPFGPDLSGLCEGALLTNASGHRIIIAVIGTMRDAPPLEISALAESGIQVVQSGGAGLVNAICQAVNDIPKIRIKNRSPMLIPAHKG
ncbi:MAG: DUF58 domain-containing protein [Candidatus Bathyarchaeia archaeon]|jgi:hypothetical protein